MRVAQAGHRAGHTRDVRHASRRTRQAREALRMIARRPLRSVLLASSVAVSVGAFFTAEAIAERGRLATIREIGRMGATVIIVSAQPSRVRGTRARTNAAVTTLTLRDAREIALTVTGVSTMSVEYRGAAPVKIGALARQASVSGVEASYALLRSAPMARGHFFDESEAIAAQRVVVLGAQLARDLLGDDDPVGETLWVRGIPFRIVGVLPARGTGLDAFDEDGVAFIPIRTAQRRLFQVDYIQRLFVRVDERWTTLDEAARAIARVLAVRHHVPDDSLRAEEADFRVETQGRLLDMRRTSATRLRVFEIGAAVLLLGAGAGGTLALQQLTVRTRIAEVGTRRALGASAHEIFRQFFLEATFSSVTGAGIGLALAWAAERLVGVSLPRAMGPAVFVACVVSCVGFACIPTWRAARLPPAQALRTL